MSKAYGEHYPERPFMSTISDLLGIPHFSTSNGGTVRSDFLEAALSGLGVSDPRVGTKEDKIRRLWEVANQSKMPNGRLSRGGTVTNIVLGEIIGGIINNGLNATGVDRDCPDVPDDLDAGYFDPTGVEDTRERRVAYQAIRQGQDRFRTDVLAAYGSVCAITGVDVAAVLDAAHIHPYMGMETNMISNGLPLRTDLHRLFDRHLITIDNLSLEVRVSPLVENSPGYHGLRGTVITNPKNRQDYPSRAALEGHNQEFEEKLLI